MPPKKRNRDPVDGAKKKRDKEALDAFTTNEVVQEHMASWACKWHNRKHNDGDSGTTEKVGVGKNESLALATLQQHYPQIVYLCFLWWRKLMVLKADNVAAEGDEFLTRRVKSSAPDLGLLGALSKVHLFLPKWSLQQRRPLVLGAGGWKQKSGFGSFLSLAIENDQRDVVACLVKNLQLNCGEGSDGKWEPLIEVAARFDRHKIVGTMLELHQIRQQQQQAQLDGEKSAAEEDPNADQATTTIEQLVDRAFAVAVAHNSLNTAKMLLEDHDVSNVSSDVRLAQDDEVFKQPDALSWPGLHHAAHHNYLEMARLLLKHGASVDPDAQGLTALHYASDPEFVSFLLDTTSVDVASSCAISGTTALHRRICWQNPNVMKLLLEKGADLHQVTQHQRTPIQMFFNTSLPFKPSIYLRMMKLVVHYGGVTTGPSPKPVVAMQFRGGNFPLHLVAGQGGRSEDNTTSEMPFHTETLKFLLDQGADLEATNDAGDTALFIAVASHRGVKPNVELLVERGANVNAMNNKQETPITRLIRTGRNYVGVEELLKFLLGAGSRIDHVTPPLGSSILHLQFQDSGAWPELISMYIEKGASVTATDTLGQTPLDILARCSRSAEVAKQLIAAGADPNAKTSDGVSPLYMAVADFKANGAFAQALLDAGADPHAKNKCGRSPMDTVFDSLRSWNGRLFQGGAQEVLLNLLPNKAKLQADGYQEYLARKCR